MRLQCRCAHRPEIRTRDVPAATDCSGSTHIQDWGSRLKLCTLGQKTSDKLNQREEAEDGTCATCHTYGRARRLGFGPHCGNSRSKVTSQIHRNGSLTILLRVERQPAHKHVFFWVLDHQSVKSSGQTLPWSEKPCGCPGERGLHTVIITCLQTCSQTGHGDETGGTCRQTHPFMSLFADVSALHTPCARPKAKVLRQSRDPPTGTPHGRQA
mmetsp:Transcript_33426/g.55952  ORF Transcript_33426/g.55952 Transcript_33426/m.55952 type:complete len:212 (-) Transcript_33426:510-1145(-)